MNRVDVVRMCQEAGMTGVNAVGLVEHFERFAELVIEAETGKRIAIRLTEDEIDSALGHEPLDYLRGFSAGVRYAESMHGIKDTE